jgi:ATP-dependent Lhr-like helicase
MTESSHQSHSNSNSGSGFESLHPDIQRWIYSQNWSELREVQSQAIDAVLSSDNDLVIAATTAAGKTEAAFLPVLTKVLNDKKEGFRIVYIGPLRALINDQFLRLESLCAAVKLPVTKWHGDVGEAMKKKARERPSGVILITPESLEALFVRRPEIISRMFGQTSFIIVDELHSFLSSERGVQLGSLLKRLELRIKRAPRRIGLSATIGDLKLAANWLRPNDPSAVDIINLNALASEVRLQIKGIHLRSNLDAEKQKNSNDRRDEDTAMRQIASDLYKIMRAKGNHLVFAPSRREVEVLADMLRVMCESSCVPNEFFPHHGSLARELRETLEDRLKEGSLPTTAITTTTLELGIDIGSVVSVAQVGAPRSVSGMRQRLGRSGRREGMPSVLRIYTREREIDGKSSLLERLRLDTIQSVAAVQLFLEKWVEPPSVFAQHLSTLLHQILAVITERGGATYAQLKESLGGAGSFSAVDEATFRALLQGMATTIPPLMETSSDGTLMLGPLGEKIVENYEFFAVFKTPEEFKIIANGKTLGAVSILNAFGPGDYVVFAGQRWKVISVDDHRHEVQVETAPAGRAPRFEGGEPGSLHDRLVEMMRDVLTGSSAPPAYLDGEARKHFDEGRESFRVSGLNESNVALDRNQIILLPWRGTSTLDTLRLALRLSGLTVQQSSIALSVAANDRDKLFAALNEIAHSPQLDGAKLAEFDENLQRAKFDEYIPRNLLRQAAAIDRLNTSALPEISKRLISDLNTI